MQQIPFPLHQTLPSRRHALTGAWYQCRQFGLFGLHRHASLLQGIVGFALCTLLLYSFVHLFIPPPSFRYPLMTLGETIDFEGSIQQRVLQLWPSWLNRICSISIGTSSAGNCCHSSHRFYLEGRPELAASSWVPDLPGSDALWELAFLHTRDVSSEITHNHVVLFDDFLIRAGVGLTGTHISNRIAWSGTHRCAIKLDPPLCYGLNKSSINYTLTLMMSFDSLQ